MSSSSSSSSSLLSIYSSNHFNFNNNNNIILPHYIDFSNNDWKENTIIFIPNNNNNEYYPADFRKTNKNGKILLNIQNLYCHEQNRAAEILGMSSPSLCQKIKDSQSKKQEDEKKFNWPKRKIEKLKNELSKSLHNNPKAKMSNTTLYSMLKTAQNIENIAKPCYIEINIVNLLDKYHPSWKSQVLSKRKRLNATNENSHTNNSIRIKEFSNKKIICPTSIIETYLSHHFNIFDKNNVTSNSHPTIPLQPHIHQYQQFQHISPIIIPSKTSDYTSNINNHNNNNNSSDIFKSIQHIYI